MFNLNNRGEQVIVWLIDWSFKTDMKGVRLRISIQTIMIIEIQRLSVYWIFQNSNLKNSRSTSVFLATYVPSKGRSRLLMALKGSGGVKCILFLPLMHLFAQLYLAFGWLFVKALSVHVLDLQASSPLLQNRLPYSSSTFTFI